jgi:peptidoglycan/xylan/chitin deacetylase (PgdA/CDA1 family)
MRTELWLAARALGASRVLDGAYGAEPIVLMYHRFSERPQSGHVHRAALEQQLAFLGKHCDVLAMGDLRPRLGRDGQRDRPAVVITIDDAYQDAYDIAYPLLRRYDLPATIFATSAFVDRRMWYWQDKLRYVLDQTASRMLPDAACGSVAGMSLASAADKERAWQVLADHCFAGTDLECERLVGQLGDCLDVQIPVTAPPGFAALTWRQLAEMADNGVETGAHTVSHRRMSQLSEQDVVAEIAGCKREIESELHRPARFFAYPYGANSDRTPAAERAVRHSGFELAFVAYFDALLYDNPLAVRRFGVGSDMWDFVKSAHGLKRANCIRKLRRMQRIAAAGVQA